MSREGISRATDTWLWKQIRLAPLLPGMPYLDQLAKVPQGERPVTARELVMFLTLRFLATGERLGDGWLRTNDVLENGNRVMVGFGQLGIEFGGCPDPFVSPVVGLATVFVPPTRRK